MPVSPPITERPEGHQPAHARRNQLSGDCRSHRTPSSSSANPPPMKNIRAPAKCHGEAGVFGDQPHNDGPGTCGDTVRTLAPEGSRHQGTRCAARPNARRHAGPGRDAQQSGGQEQRPEEHAQPLHHERGIHEPCKRRAHGPVLVDAAVDGPEVADVAGPAGRRAPGPPTPRSPPTSATKYCSTLSWPSRRCTARVDGSVREERSGLGRTLLMPCHARHAKSVVRAPAPCMLVSVPEQDGLVLNLSDTHALVAQWIEHGSPKAGVVGSIPIEGT